MGDWREYIDQRLRPRASRDTVIKEVMDKFDHVTQHEISLYMGEQKDYEKDQELEYLRAEHDRFTKKHAFYDEIRHYVIKHSASLQTPLAPLAVERVDDLRGEEIMVAVNSDQHLGLNVDDLEAPSEIPNSTYNMKVAENRIAYYTEKILRITNEKRKTRILADLYLVYTGDSLQGNWDGLNHTKDLAVKQVLEGTRIISSQIAQLAPHFRKINVVVVDGNHSRFHKKFPRHESWEYLMWKGCIEPRLESLVNVEVNVSSHMYNRFSVFDHKFLLIHGDGVKMYYKTPYYGIETQNDNLYSILSQHGHPYDYLIMGHFHFPSKLGMKNGTAVMCGSTTGYQPYALEKMGKYTPPSQCIFGVHPKRGLTWHYDIDLSGVGETRVSGATAQW